MGARFIGAAGVVAAVIVFAPTAADAAAPVTIVSGANARTVTLTRQTDDTLGGRLVLLVGNNSGKSARLRLRFFPADGSKPITFPGGDDSAVVLLSANGGIARQAPRVRARRVGEVVLRFELPRDASPSRADGQLSVALELSDAKGKPTIVRVNGEGASFPGIAFQPAKVTLRSTSRWPWEDAPDPSEPVHLAGPGLPELFADSVATPDPSVFVLDSAGHDLQVSLESVRLDSPLVATAEIKATGDLEPGGYDTKLPLSALSAEAPALDVRVEANDLFVWPAVAVLVGALIALLAFLATGVNRRKALLRIQLRAVLERYRKERESLGAPSFEQPAAIWALDDLGDPAHWYERKWDALPELDGARGIWSSISYARSDADLEEDEQRVLAVQVRATWWLKTLRYAKDLDQLDQLRERHLPYAGHMWVSTNTCNDTQKLLSFGEEEPADDAAAEKLIGRLRRQARWHRAFAEVWDLWVQLGKHMDANESSYADAQRGQFKNLGLDKLDERAVEAQRTPENQRVYEHELEIAQRVILDLMRQGRVPPPEDAPREFELAEVSPDDAYRKLVSPAPSPVVARAEDKPTRSEAYEGVIRSDVVWTLAIALLTAVVYIVPLYSSTWGSPTDYGTAFAAGFLGKVGIQWAAMPLFQSLRLRVKRGREEGGDSTQPQVAKATGAAPT